MNILVAYATRHVPLPGLPSGSLPGSGKPDIGPKHSPCPTLGTSARTTPIISHSLSSNLACSCRSRMTGRSAGSWRFSLTQGSMLGSFVMGRRSYCPRRSGQ